MWVNQPNTNIFNLWLRSNVFVIHKTQEKIINCKNIFFVNFLSFSMEFYEFNRKISKCCLLGIGNILQISFYIGPTEQCCVVICEHITVIQYWEIPLECAARALRSTTHAQMCVHTLKFDTYVNRTLIDARDKKDTVDNAKELLMLVWIRFQLYTAWQQLEWKKQKKKWSKVTNKKQ